MRGQAAVRKVMCAALLLASSFVLGQADKPAAIGNRSEAPKLPCTNDCAALPDAPSAIAVEVIPEPPPKPYSLVGPMESAPFVRLTSKQKFGIFLHHTYSPYTAVSAGLNATWAQMVGDLPGYGGGMRGWGQRFGATLAATESRSLIGSFLVPVITHQDPRYFPMRKGTVFQRGWYAATRVLVTRTDDGGHAFNWSEILGVAGTIAISNAYLPSHERGTWKTFSRVYGALGGDAGGLILEEFWPDIKRFYRRHAPRQVKNLEERLPLHMME